MAAAPCTRLEWHKAEGGEVALLVLDHPTRGANLLSAAVLDEIEGHLDALAERKPAGLVFISAKPGMFIAGADLTEFAASVDHPKDHVIAVSRRGQQLFSRLAETPFVTVAAIDGICVGGGAELTVWCDRRIVTDNPKTQFGFPEVKLGLFPGWGGTARTPRMVGLANAVELVTGGENVGPSEASKLGLADHVVALHADDSANNTLTEAALRMILEEQKSEAYLVDRKRWSSPIAISETELAFLGATASAVIQQKTGGHYPAPQAALELMLEASQSDLVTACELEAERFAPLFGSPVNRALLNVFFLTDRAKKEGGSAKEKVATATVLGAGTMGQGIAAANIKRGVPVLLSDARPEALAAGVSAVVEEAAYDKHAKGPSAAKAVEMAGRISAATEPSQLAGAEVVIEAIYEDADAKQKLFAELEPHAGEATILCSNTSTIPITQLADGLEHPERFAGLHFFNPVRKMPLVEVIRGAKSSEETIARLTAYARQLGKTPVVVNDGPGFLVNRLLMPYMAEAALMVAEGVPIKAIEKAAKKFGMPMGPLTLHDVVGLDVCLHAGRVMQQAFPDRVAPATLVASLVEAGRLGQKNGKGFFDYPRAKPGKPPKGVPSGEVEALIQAEGGKGNAGEFDLTDRLMLPMLVEATRAIENGIVTDVRDVDLALILGIGFPPFRGGLFHWADTLGAEVILEKLKPLTPLGKRFEATEIITQAATSGRSFY
ncbi:MAG: 3-hydroxyacyl-CoA dehydrogenase NAD-binding domain-containing protein [Planctomycetota bacterium]